MIIKCYKYIFYILISLLSICNTIIAQKSSDDTLIHKPRLGLVIASTSLGYAGTMTALSKAWYSKQSRSQFHFFDDASEWKQMDKMGHLYMTYHESEIFTDLLLWCNLSKNQSIVIGTTTAFLIQNSIELFDGYATTYGASATDIIANGLGSALYLSQMLTFKDTYIIPKFSFSTSSLASQRPNVLGSNLAEQIIKDYNGQTYWLSFNIKHLLLKNKNFPAWVAISMGYGAQNMIYATDVANTQIGLKPFRQYFLSLDIDLSKIKTKHKAVSYMLKRLNMIHIPFPALEFSDNSLKFHPYYF